MADPYAFPWWEQATSPQKAMQSRASARPSSPPGAGMMASMSPVGLGLQVAGAISGAIGDYYSAKNQKLELQMQALSMDFEANVSSMNAAQAERDASFELEANRRNLVAAGQAAGQAMASQRVTTAAAGVAADSASSAEVQASMDYARKVDESNMTVAAVRAANAQRRIGVDLRNRSLIARTSASNTRRTAQTIRPGLAAATSLIGSSGSLLSNYARS